MNNVCWNRQFSLLMVSFAVFHVSEEVPENQAPSSIINYSLLIIHCVYG
jgi:hypothetical protein